MFRVSIGSFEDAVGFLEEASSAADNIAYRTDLLLADFRPLAEGSFADASAEAGAGIGVKAKLLSLSLFALLETMRAASDALSGIMDLRRGVLEAAGTGGVTDPVLDAGVNVEGSAEAASASARGVAAKLEEAEGLLAGIHFPGGVAGSLAYAISWAAKQGSYADSAAEAYVAYKGGVESFEAEFAPLFDEGAFLQVDSTLGWCCAEASSGGAGIGALLGAPGAIGDGMDIASGALLGLSRALDGNEAGLVQAWEAIKALGADGARALSKALSDEGTLKGLIAAMEANLKDNGGDLIAAIKSIDWFGYGVDGDDIEALVSNVPKDKESILNLKQRLTELGGAARESSQRLTYYSKKTGKVAAGIDLLLACGEAGPVGPERVAAVAAEGAVIFASGKAGDFISSGAGVVRGGIVGGFMTPLGAVAGVAAGFGWEWFKSTPEGADFQRDVDGAFMAASGFGSVHPNDYFSEAAKREQLKANEDERK
ncbi:MAG: hypothetical protein E7001_00080 [Coriobacteriaceae bacterium]|nr:hypothetical protein [Coriobacteriaceae bacterium]